MAYMLHGTNTEILGMRCDEAHTLMAYCVRVSPTTRGRWATVTCSCGAAARSLWEDTTATYRSLVFVAWYDACGSTALRGAESLQQPQE